MKKILNQFLLLSFMVTMLASCKKDENKLYFEGNETTPVLAASSTAPLALDILRKADPAITFSWNNPDYKFTTGLSSQTVNYVLEIDKAGANFTSAARKLPISPVSALSQTITVGDLNAKLLAIGIPADSTRQVEVRLIASLKTTDGNLIKSVTSSNTITLTVTPYLDVKFPVPANLYITGSATPASWQCGCGEPELLSQKFTKVSLTKFELTIKLTGGGSYLFLPAYGSWSHKYGYANGGNNNNDVTGDDFKPEGSDMKAPAATGIYKITVDFTTGRWTVAP